MSKRPQRQPIYLRAVRLVDPESGQEVSALVPHGQGDHAEIRRRGITIGAIMRGQLTRPRSLANHNRAHALGDLLRGNLDEYSGLDAHGAIKELQRRSGVGCEVMSIEVPGVGTLGINKPHSVSFDTMDEGEFARLMQGLCRYIAATYWPECTPDQIEEMARLMPGEAVV